MGRVSAELLVSPKQSGVQRSHAAERLLIVVATCQQQGRRLLDFLVAAGEAALQETAAPSLFPALQGELNHYEFCMRSGVRAASASVPHVTPAANYGSRPGARLAGLRDS